jgi:hypothetical protein
VSGASLLSWLAVSPAHAASLNWSAPAECPEKPAVEAQIEHSIGRPLGEVHGIDFEVTIERQSPRKWHLELTTHARTPEGDVRARELSGQSCAEVSEAAALAIALTITSRPDAVSGKEPQLTETDTPETPVPSLKSEPAQPSANQGAQAAETADASKDSQPSAAAIPLEFSAAALIVVDTAILPAPAPGASLELAVRYGAFKAIVLGAILAEQEKELDADRGGRFRLALLGALLCLQPSAEGGSMLGCAGFELGQLSAEGIADTPLNGQATLRAVRLEVGGGYRFLPQLAAFARLGVSAPLGSTDFYFDDEQTVVVHRLGPLSLRALLGVELFL